MFKDDSPKELEWVCERALAAGAAAAAVSTHWTDGGKGRRNSLGPFQSRRNKITVQTSL